MGVSLGYDVSLRFVLLLALQTCWATFQAKNNVRSAPASSALTIMRVLQIVTYAAVEKGIELKEEQRLASVEP